VPPLPTQRNTASNHLCEQSTENSQFMKTKHYIITLLAILLSPLAHADIIELGEIDFTGNFTLNHNFNFNTPTMPFGTFGIQTVQSATGIFAPYISSGDVLNMSTQFMYVSGLTPMQWSIDGFTINTLSAGVTGADSGRYCLGLTALSGNGFDPSAYPPFGAVSLWDFTAPPYDISNFPTDITGPINLQFIVEYDDGHVPDSGSSLSLLISAWFSLLGLKLYGLKVAR
jgi:hypothetical protein